MPTRCRFCKSLNPLHDEIHIVRQNRDGSISMGGKTMFGTELQDLKGRNHLLRKSGMWHLLKDNMKRKATEIALVKSTDFDHVLVGKSMLYLISEINGIIETIEKAKEPSNR